MTETAKLPDLFGRIPGELARIWDPAAPWKILGEGLDELLAELPGDAIEIPLNPGIDLVGHGIAVGRGTRIHPGARIEGPVRIGRAVEIRAGAYLRGGCWIGDDCIIGANTEIKRGVLLPGARAPHLNYVGDSVLGEGVNLGAGTVVSNFRHDGKEIVIPFAGGRLATGRRKMGAILGDRVLTGCNCVLHPGVVMGQGCQLYPGVQLRPGVYPAQRIIKLRQQLEIVERRPERSEDRGT